MSNLNILYESSLGYGLFELVKADEVGLSTKQVQQALTDLGKFSKIVKLKSMFFPQQPQQQITPQKSPPYPNGMKYNSTQLQMSLSYMC